MDLSGSVPPIDQDWKANRLHFGDVALHRKVKVKLEISPLCYISTEPLRPDKPIMKLEQNVTIIFSGEETHKMNILC